MHGKTTLTERSLILIAGQIAATGMGILVPLVLVRIFPKEVYGLYQQLLLIFTTLLPIGQLGVTQGLYYFLPREPEKRDALMMQTFAFVLCTGALFFTVLFLFRTPLASFFNNPGMAGLLPLVGAYTFFMVGSSFIETSMIAEGNETHASLFNVASESTRSLTVVATALAAKDVGSVLCALLVFSCLRFLFQCIYLRKRFHASLGSLDFRLWKRQLRYSLPVGLANVAYLVQMKLHGFFVSFLFDPRMFAVYTVGSFNLPIVGIVTSAVGNVMTPALSRCEKEGREAEMLSIWHSAMRKMNLLFFPSFVFFFLCADQFITIFFTEAYRDSVPIFRIALFNILIAGINAGAILSAYAETGFLLRLSVLRVTATLILLSFFTRQWGVLGAITADVSISYLFRFLMLVKVARATKTPLARMVDWKPNGIILAGALISSLPVLVWKMLVHGPPWILFLSMGLIYLSSYCLLGMFLGMVSAQEIGLLARSICSKFRPNTQLGS